MSRIVRMVVWIFGFADNLFYGDEGRDASQLHRPKTLIEDEVFKRFVGSVGNYLFSHGFINGREGCQFSRCGCVYVEQSFGRGAFGLNGRSCHCAR